MLRRYHPRTCRLKAQLYVCLLLLLVHVAVGQNPNYPSPFVDPCAGTADQCCRAASSPNACAATGLCHWYKSCMWWGGQFGLCMTPPETSSVLLPLPSNEISRTLSSSDPYTSSWLEITGEIKDVCSANVFDDCGFNSILNSGYLDAPNQEERATANDCQCFTNPNLSTSCEESIKNMALWVDPNGGSK